MKIIGGAAAAVMLLASGCASGAGPSVDDPEPAAVKKSSASPSAKLLTLEQVAAAACAGKRVVKAKPDELEWFTSEGASCADDTISVALFEGPGARDSWEAVAKENGVVLVGTNWSVTAKRAVLDKTQQAIGGHIAGGF